MPYLVKVYDGISEIKRLNPTVAGSVKKVGTKQGIRGMTRRSARTLLNYLMKLEPMQNVFFLTLTYRETPSIKESKKQLNTFFTGLKYVYPKLSAVWRMEFQARGSQHFHLLFYPGEDHISPFEVQNEIRARWVKCVGDRDSHFFKNCTKTDRIQNLRGCKFYMSLHHTKQDQNRTDIDTGRCWGIVGRRNLPESIAEHFTLSDDEVIRLKRIYRGFTKAIRTKRNRCLSYTLSQTGSFTAFCNYWSMRKAIQFVRGTFSPT
jgi:hypothetical protein